MKRKLLVLVLLIIMAFSSSASADLIRENFFVTAAAEESVMISSIELSDSVKVLSPTTAGIRLLVKYTPANATNQVLTWSSTNDNVCKVDINGILQPQKNGTCVISAKTTDGSDITAYCYVRVASAAKSVVVDKTSKTLENGSSFTLKATVTTQNDETYSMVNWSSSNPSVASVDNSGKVTAHYPGNARIYATAADGTNVKASCLVTVTQSATGISLTSSQLCAKGGTVKLTPEFIPSYATEKEVKWKSSDTSVATVDKNGVVTGVKVGTATITVTTADGAYSDSCKITVERYPDSVSLNATSVTLEAGDKKALIETVLPESASNKQVSWSSSDKSVATVSSDGVVTAVAGGTAKITVKTKRGGVTATCTVKVLQNVTGVSISNAPETMYKGQTYTIKATVKPSTANNKAVTWKSSHPSIIKVDAETGKLTAVKTGRAKITVTTEDGSFTASCKITVTKKVAVTGVSLNTSSKKVPAGSTYKLVPSFEPSDASDTSVKWKSSNKEVATVSSKGVVTGVKAGTAVISCVTNDGDYVAKCKVTVTVSVKSVSLNKTSFSLGTGRKAALTATIAPTNATNRKITWSSSDTSVATVDENGVVKGIKKGTAVITVKTKDGGYKAKCTVTIFKAVKSVALDKAEATVPKGDRISLVATVSPSNAANKAVTWSSSNAAVATVSDKGVVTAKRKGTATITATTQDGSYTATCVVTVVKLAESISLDYTSISLDIDKKKVLNYKILPSSTSDKTATWKSSNKKIVRVSQKGVIRAVSVGKATITVTSGDGQVMTKCVVTVTQPATGIKLTAQTTSVAINSSITLKATVKPSNAGNKAVVWNSSNPNVATVSSKGVVTGIKKGTAEITATTANGISKTITVTVVKPVKSVSLNKTVATLAVGKKSGLTATISPSSASNKKVTWKSSNNDVATVSSKGIVTAVSPGYAVIKVVTKDGKKTATCQIHVVQAVEKIELSKTKLTLNVGKSKTVTATVLPSNATDKTIKWYSSDKSVAKVSQKGVITAVSEGTAKITVKTADGSCKSVCTVKVVKKVESVSVKSSLTVYLGSKKTLKASVLPSDATDKSVTWTSSKPSVASVSSKGVITPKKTGTTVITVKTNDGAHTATCKVTVKKEITSLKINKSSLTLNKGKTYSLTVTKKPSDATEGITWTSSKPAVATVKDGAITAVSPGSATITGTTEQGIKVKCKVTVKEKIKLSVNSVAAGEDFVIIELDPTNFKKEISFASEILTVTVNGEKAYMDIPARKNALGYYDLVIDTSSFEFKEGEEITVVIPEGVITSGGGTRYNAKYTITFVI